VGFVDLERISAHYKKNRQIVVVTVTTTICPQKNATPEGSLPSVAVKRITFFQEQKRQSISMRLQLLCV
jgi:hypothetical protein